MDPVGVIKAGDSVILKRGNDLKLMKIFRNRNIFLSKRNFSIDPAIGKPYGTVWDVVDRTIKQVESEQKEQESEGSSGGHDNRSLVDDGRSQRLTRDDIVAMKSQGVQGQELVEQIVEHSTTFKSKTVFSQAKYLKKKKNKHLLRFRILRPSIRLLCDAYMLKGPSKNLYIRMDTMSQILTQGNIQAGLNVLLVETCQGLLLSAVVERMAGHGKLVQIHSEDIPVRQAFDSYNFPEEYKKVIHSFPMNQVASIFQEEVEECKMDEEVSVSKKQRLEGEPECSAPSLAERNEPSEEGDEKADSEQMVCDEKDVPSEDQSCENVKQTQMAIDQERKLKKKLLLNEARSILKAKNMDVLLIASKFQPEPLLMTLIDLVLPSRQVVVYSPFREALVECYTKLRKHGGVVNISITETWLREYQVLPDRTHPMMTMNASGGFLLTGTTVTLDH
ncbi:tRNA (adenine(58)-N(1))-methyltransferase non-catalytic subunit TRM6-like [Anneissia japonica]|uniref:tRNA (adenine(58)-N(1))-methyltransferase non-catalytic subunit TRM6-like n=1 Tax=Anneissia japonica TaxID=1529436 RepID=UPI0014256AFD|nr:tRNA (adenine(58)-N(1))-methyltransferase non-catalytic subunit TRM6-like [Anneissia japonica]